MAILNTAQTVAGTTGVADGTGPLLLHVSPAPTAGAIATAAPTAGATATATGASTAGGVAMGATVKTAIASKIAALGVTGGALLGFALAAAAAACAGYLGYRIIKSRREQGKPAQPQKATVKPAKSLT